MVKLSDFFRTKDEFLRYFSDIEKKILFGINTNYAIKILIS